MILELAVVSDQHLDEIKLLKKLITTKDTVIESCKKKELTLKILD